jgi:rfaE bifunctional protein kinase chain/domain
MLADKVRLLQQKPSKPVILVIGDLMIDHYVWGSANRLSPEAPVPVVNVQKEESTLGGAANVAQNLISLGADVMLAGLIGQDEAGQEMLKILLEENINTKGIFQDISRSTTSKSRIIVGSHQIVRVDREITHPIGTVKAYEFFEILKPQIAQADIILLSDYNKGLFTPELTTLLINYCNEQGKKVIVDPKGLDYGKYKGAYIIKPNRKEIAEAVKRDKIANHDELVEAAHQLLSLTAATYLIVTLSEEGLVIVSNDSYQILPVKATEVFDVTGAGDTVLATLAYFITQGFEISEACELANYAAAIVIKRIGSASTNMDEILKIIEN